MAYRLQYSDYPGTAEGPPDPARWVGPPGPPGPPGIPGPPGPATTEATVYTADTPPVGVADSTLWWDSSGTGLYILYDDGNSTQWVVAQNQQGLTDAPADGNTYGRFNHTWTPVTGGSGGTAGVSSFNTRTGAVALTLADVQATGVLTAGSPGAFSTLSASGTVSGAGFTGLLAPYAPLASPAFTGTPTLPTGATGVTQSPGNNTTLLATTQFVTAAIAGFAPGVTAFNGRSGSVTLTSGDVTTALSFTPYNATNPAGYQTAAQVVAALAVGSPGAFSTLSASGTVSGAGFVSLLAPYAPLASPAFTGVPTTAATPAPGDSTTKLATTAFVANAVSAATTGVASFNTRTGAVTLSSTDVTTALTFTPYNATNPSGYQTAAQVVSDIAGGNPGVFSTLSATGTVSGAGFTALLSPYALIAAPTFTGDAKAVTAAPGDNDTSIATTAFVTTAIGTATSGGPFLPTAGGTMTGALNVKATGSTTARSEQDRWAAAANVLDYGAAGNGSTDDTAAINAAIATGHHVYIPRGTYKVSAVLSLTTLGQHVYGDGIDATTISVPATFSTSLAGVFVMTANAGNTASTLSVAGPSIADMNIVFAQVDTSTVGSLIQFPPAIYITQTQRWRVERVKIVAGWNGIYAYANAGTGNQQDSVGGGYIYDCLLGCLNTNIYIDGAKDTIQVHHCHIFPFGLTANQSLIQAGSTIGIDVYRADDLKLHANLFLVSLAVRFGQNANGPCFGEITGCDFDTYSGISMSAGYVVGSGNLFGATNAGTVGINMTGGQMTMNGCQFFSQNATAAPVVVQSAGAVYLSLTNFIIQTTNYDISSIAINTTATNSAFVVLGDGVFQRNGNVAYTKPTVYAGNGSILSMVGCQASIKGSGAGVFVQATQDNFHRIIGNTPIGWTNSFPTATTSIFVNNTPGDGGGGGGSYLPLTGGTLTGPLAISETTTDAALSLQANAGYNREIIMDTVGGSNPGPRWTVGANTTAESGSSAGSDYQIVSYSDTGTPAIPFTITRSTGVANFSVTPTVGGVAIGGGSGTPSSTTPIMDGTGAAGSATTYARGDHVHPSDTSRAPLASPAFTGTPSLPTGTTGITQTAGTNNTTIATTAYVGAAVTAAAVPAPNTVTTPVMDGTATIGTLTTYARPDHVHPSDTSRAPVASPTFTGVPAGPTAAVGTNTTQLATTAFVAATATNIHDVGRNKLHNPLFRVQQRNQGPWTATGYTADRWLLTATTDTVSVTAAALADADRTGIGDEEATWGLQNVFTGNAAAGAFNNVCQRIENVHRLSGKSVTVSFWAKATTGTPKIGVNWVQNFGSGGSPSASVTGTAQASANLSTTWTRYTFTFAITSASGKTLGTAQNSDYTELDLWFSSGATNNTAAGSIGVQSGTALIWGAQLEVGSAATSLEKPDLVTEYTACQRYYQIGNYSWYGYGGASGLIGGQYNFYVWMRGVPAIVLSGPTYTNATGAASTGVLPGSFVAYAIATAAAAANFGAAFTATADL